MATQLRFRAHNTQLAPPNITSAPSLCGWLSHGLSYEQASGAIERAEGDVIYERVGSLKKRSIVKTVTKDFEIGKEYSSSYGKVWTCYLRTPLGWLFTRPNGALLEVDKEGRNIPKTSCANNHVIFAQEVVMEVTGEEWYIDRTDV